MTPFKSALRIAGRHPAAAIAALFLLGLTLLALLAPWLRGDSPWAMVAAPLLPPFSQWAHPLGTDMLGRDLFTGLLYGARSSLLVGALSTFLTLLIGVGVGAVAGYNGGWIDALLMRIAEFFLILPALFLAVILVSVLEPSTSSVVLAITLVAWPSVARLVRSEFLTLRQREFVLAARVSGQSAAQIILRQILPNALTPVLVVAGFVMATAILTEAALSFLGLGDPDGMSWGYMINASRNLLRDAWWMSLWPGLAILLTVLAVNLLTEGLRSALGRQGGRHAD